MRRMLSVTVAAVTLATLTSLGLPSIRPALARDHDDYASASNCVNPAGHIRGRCRHANPQGAALAGRVVSIGGPLVQFRRNSGRLITLDQQPLLAAGVPLLLGRYYSLRGYWSNGLFYATTIRSWTY